MVQLSLRATLALAIALGSAVNDLHGRSRVQ